MKKFNWKPKTVKINLKQEYFNGIYSPTMTGTPHYYWIGYKYIKWLFWEFKMDFKDFNIFNKQITFKKALPKDTEITMSYYCNV